MTRDNAAQLWLSDTDTDTDMEICMPLHDRSMFAYIDPSVSTRLAAQSKLSRFLAEKPEKAEDARAHGLGRIMVERHVTGVGEHYRHPLTAKGDRGNAIDEGDLGASELGEPRRR